MSAEKLSANKQGSLSEFRKRVSAEIQDNFKAISTEMVHEEKKDWPFFRKAAQEVHRKLAAMGKLVEERPIDQQERCILLDHDVRGAVFRVDEA